MARPRADDYLDKQQLILDRAAILFARKGFAGTSIAVIAESCNTSKALIYHYYQSKESMLFDMLNSHCQLLLKTAQEIMQESTAAPEQKLRALLRSFMEIYVSARAKHVVLLNDLHWLPDKQQKQIRELQRKVVDIFKILVRAIRQDVSETTVTALAMSLMGSINWTYIWFKPEGALTPQKYADITAGLFFAGIDGVGEEHSDIQVKGLTPKIAAARIRANGPRAAAPGKALGLPKIARSR